MHPSPGLAQLLGSLSGGPRPARVLDLGRADEATLNFLGGRGLEVQVAALEPPSGANALLPEFEAAAFRAILGWDVPMRLAKGPRDTLARSLSTWLAPAGLLHLVLPLREGPPHWTYRFRVLGESRLEYFPQQPLPAASIPSTRDVLDWFPDLDCSGALILRHGAREFLFRRRGAVR